MMFSAPPSDYYIASYIAVILRTNFNLLMGTCIWGSCLFLLRMMLDEFLAKNSTKCPIRYHVLSCVLKSQEFYRDFV